MARGSAASRAFSQLVLVLRCGSQVSMGYFPEGLSGPGKSRICDKKRIYLCYGKQSRCWCFVRRSDHFICCWIVLGVVLFIAAFALPALINSTMQAEIIDALTFSSAHGDAFSAWQTNTDEDAPVVHYDLYLYDVVNAHEVVCDGLYDSSYREPCPGQKPALVERGPYAYKKMYSRFDVDFDHNGDRVSYYEKTYYVWDEARAGPGLSENDVVTQPSITSNYVKNLLEQLAAKANSLNTASGSVLDASSNCGLEREVRAWSRRAADKLRDMTHKQHSPNNGVDAAAEAIYNLGNSLADALAAFDGDGWRLLLKLLLCAAPPDGDSPFHSRSVHDIYFGYWDDPIMELFGALVALGGDGHWITWTPGFASNYTSEEDARRRTTGPTVVNTGGAGKGTRDLHNYYLYEGMSSLFVCLNPKVHGNEENHTVDVCAKFDESWDISQAEDNGYIVPWESVEDCPISGYSNGEGFEPFRADARHKNRKIYISDIYRSLELRPSSNYEWRGIPLTRLELRDEDMQTANCSWAWPLDDAKSCNKDNARYYCFGPSGLLNMSKLSGGVELFASKPHFLGGHPWLQEQFNGALHPDSERHNTYLDVEPITGEPFRLAERLQISLKLDDWDLPQVPFSAYFGWRTRNESDIIEAALRAAYLTARDYAFKGIEKVVEADVKQICAASLHNRKMQCNATASILRETLYEAVRSLCNHTHSSVIVDTDAKGSPEGGVCSALESLWEEVFSERLVRKLIKKVINFCDTNSDKCNIFYQDVYDEVKQFVEDACSDKSPSTEAICAAGKFIFHGATDIFKAVGRFCTTGICELAPLVLNGTGPLYRLEKKEEIVCAKSKHFRNETCALLQSAETSLVHSMCNKIIELPINMSHFSHNTINTSHICRVIKTLLYDDNFNMDNDGDDFNYEHDLTHGTFWNKMNDFCTCKDERQHGKDCIKQRSECKLVQKGIGIFCDENTELCDEIFSLAGNWEEIDHTFLNLTAKLEVECNSGLCEDLGLVPGEYKTQVEEEIMQFCNGSSTLTNISIGAQKEHPLASDEIDAIAMNVVTILNHFGAYPEEFSENDVSDIFFEGSRRDINYPDGDLVRALMKLGEVCPVLSITVRNAIDKFCDIDDKIHNNTCKVLSSIPWTTVEVGPNDGPVLSYISSQVTPALEGLVGDIKSWCSGNDEASHTGWHAYACAAVREFARDELIQAFNLLVQKLDENTKFNLTAAVTTAEAWLKCVLGESKSPIPKQGYYVPLVWTDEWMDLSSKDTNLFKGSVLRVQDTSDTIHIWCLGLSLLSFVLAVSGITIRRLVKLDYEASERLIPAELVAHKLESSGRILSGEYYSGEYHALGDADSEAANQYHRPPLGISSSGNGTFLEGPMTLKATIESPDGLRLLNESNAGERRLNNAEVDNNLFLPQHNNVAPNEVDRVDGILKNSGDDNPMQSIHLGARMSPSNQYVPGSASAQTNGTKKKQWRTFESTWV